MATKATNSAVMAMLKELARNSISYNRQFNEAVEIIAAHFGIDRDVGSVYFHWDEGVVWDAQRWG